jgi:two-component system, OmpR family, response regulator
MYRLKRSMDNLTTGQAAKISLLSRNTIIRMMNKGRLKGWRVPGSKHRRLRAIDLVVFLNDNKIPIPDELRGIGV